MITWTVLYQYSKMPSFSTVDTKTDLSVAGLSDIFLCGDRSIVWGCIDWINLIKSARYILDLINSTLSMHKNYQEYQTVHYPVINDCVE